MDCELFSVTAPILWYSLAADIRCTTSLSIFKTKIKTFNSFSIELLLNPSQSNRVSFLTL